MAEEVLIEGVRRYSCLYDKNHEDYRDPHVRQTAWEEIGKELRMPGPTAKDMWDKLRRCYTNARNRCLDGRKNGSGVRKKIIWKFEKQMSFLLPFLETRKAHSSLTEIKSESEDYSGQIPGFETTHPGQISVDPEENYYVYEERGFQSQDTFLVSENGETPQQKNLNELRQKSPTTQHHPVASLGETAPPRKRKRCEANPSSGLKCTESLDETDLFFLSMSRMTKKLPKFERTRIKLELSKLVLSAEAQHLQSNASLRDSQHYCRCDGRHSPTYEDSSSE